MIPRYTGNRYIMKLDVYSATELQQRAQAGDVQAIAYWLNLYLLPQQQCARVSPLSSGYLDIQVRCRTVPDGDRLLQVIHERLCCLSLPNLRGTKIQISVDRPYPRVLEDRFLIFQPVGSSIQPAQKRSSKASKAIPWPKLPISSLTHHLQHGGTAIYGHAKGWASAVRDFVTAEHVPVSRPAAAIRLSKSLDAPLLRPPVLLGAAIATFVVGCSYEALTYYNTSPLRASSRIFPSVPVPMVSRSDRPLPTVVDTIQVGKKQVPVYTLTSSNTGKGAIALLFTPVAEGEDPVAVAMAQYPSDVVLLALDSPSQVSGVVSDVIAPSGRLKATDATVPPTNQAIAHLSGQFMNQAGNGSATRARNTLEWQGIYTTRPAQRPSAENPPLIVEMKGQRVAFLSYTFSDVQDSTLDAVRTRLADDVSNLRDQVDWIVVNYDTSDSLASYPADWQTSAARFAIDQGADVVVGYNTNTVQGAERYRSGAIAYALGHLKNEDSDEAASDASVPVAFQVQLRRDRPVQAELIPITAAASPTYHRSMLYLQQASGLFSNPIPAPIEDSDVDADSFGNDPDALGRDDKRRSRLAEQDEQDSLDSFTTDSSEAEN